MSTEHHIIVGPQLNLKHTTTMQNTSKSISLAALKSRIHRNTVYLTPEKHFILNPAKDAQLGRGGEPLILEADSTSTGLHKVIEPYYLEGWLVSSPEDANRASRDLLRRKLKQTRQPFEEIPDFGWSPSGIVFALDRPRLETYSHLAGKYNQESILFVPAQQDSDKPCIFEIAIESELAHVLTLTGEHPDRYSPLYTNEVLSLLNRIKNAEDWEILLSDKLLKINHLKNELTNLCNSFNIHFGEYRYWFHDQRYRASVVDGKLRIADGLDRKTLDEIHAYYKRICDLRTSITEFEQTVTDHDQA